MKNFNTMRLLSVVMFTCSLLCADAQDYLVTTKGDTLAGDIKPLLFDTSKKVQVTDAGKKKTVFSLFEVKSFMQDGEVFKPVKGPAGYTFMKVMKSGYLSLLAFQPEGMTTFDGRYLLLKDGRGVEVPNLSFKKTLKNFLSGCGVVADKIEAGDLAKRDLDRIIDEYNACIEGNQTVINKAIAQREVKQEKLSPWQALENKVKARADFEQKDDALEMIAEIKAKIARSEKVPNFMVDGLKSTLPASDFQPELDDALKTLN
jgi:hypothetical protein